MYYFYPEAVLRYPVNLLPITRIRLSRICSEHKIFCNFKMCYIIHGGFNGVCRFKYKRTL